MHIFLVSVGLFHFPTIHSFFDFDIIWWLYIRINTDTNLNDDPNYSMSKLAKNEYELESRLFLSSSWNSSLDQNLRYFRAKYLKTIHPENKQQKMHTYQIKNQFFYPLFLNLSYRLLDKSYGSRVTAIFIQYISSKSN